MTVAGLIRAESHITPPSTPGMTAEPTSFEPLDMATKTCVSKNCIHKATEEADKSTGRKGKGKKVEPDTDSSEEDDSSSESSDSGSDASSDSEEDLKSSKKSKSKSKSATKTSKRRNRRRGRGKRAKKSSKEESVPQTSTAAAESGSTSGELVAVETALKAHGIDLKALLSALGGHVEKPADKAEEGTENDDNESDEDADDSSDDDDSTDSDEDVKTKRKAKKDKKRKKDKRKKNKKTKSGTKAEFKRLDEIWDEEIYDYKLKETNPEKQEDEYAQYTFTVRRKFDDEGHHQKTVVYINSELLKESLASVLSDVETVSLVESVPQIDPNMLFLFLDELKALVDTLKKERKQASKKKAKKAIARQMEHVQVLIDYLDKDYDETKKRLIPLLQNGRISFDLLWALFKPNTLTYAAMYNDDEQPRAFTVVSGYLSRDYNKGTYYAIEGQYLDFDGRQFGPAKTYAEVLAFQGTRKITSLACYPLQYYSDSRNLKIKLLERSKKFLTLAGMNYKLYKGMAYMKKDDKILKANVSGRIMIDPGTFRRVNPNYPLNDVQPRDNDEMDENDDCSCKINERKKTKAAESPTRMFRLLRQGKDDAQVVEVDATEQEDLEKHVDTAEKEKELRNTFSETELLTASAVLPGFSFTEKTWLEFAVSEVKEVAWNEGAFESLVLPEKHKSIVRALVSAHAMHASKEIDDVIAGKGKGLVAVLHGRPGLGKTLTCEAVSDLLRRPLYTVSAGDLGTGASQLETELQSILDIAHTWGAVLLLDEADVFLEERSIHDVHRNALVSIFLRLLEYFQGILFLTTNRVETFDEAFVSRIHLSLRYNDLTSKAKKSVWKTFIDKVRATDGMEVGPITENDYNDLARQDMNGRQIKNLVKTAQALALHEGVPMDMSHIRKVIDVSKDFEKDLKGGRGFEDAMRSYT